MTSLFQSQSPETQEDFFLIQCNRYTCIYNYTKHCSMLQCVCLSNAIVVALCFSHNISIIYNFFSRCIFFQGCKQVCSTRIEPPHVAIAVKQHHIDSRCCSYVSLLYGLSSDFLSCDRNQPKEVRQARCSSSNQPLITLSKNIRRTSSGNQPRRSLYTWALHAMGY